MKDKIVFTHKVSRFGKNKQLLIYIPASIGKLVEYQKEYKITLEEVEESDVSTSEV